MGFLRHHPTGKVERVDYNTIEREKYIHDNTRTALVTVQIKFRRQSYFVIDKLRFQMKRKIASQQKVNLNFSIFLPQSGVRVTVVAVGSKNYLDRYSLLLMAENESNLVIIPSLENLGQVERYVDRAAYMVCPK